MEICCLKMTSRFRPIRPMRDITQLSSTTASHDCGALSRVVMVRKTDQRIINHKGSQKDPMCEVFTMETIQTYKGHKPDRTAVFKAKFDLTKTDMCRLPSTTKVSEGAPELTISTLTTCAELEELRQLRSSKNKNFTKVAAAKAMHSSTTTGSTAQGQKSLTCRHSHSACLVDHLKTNTTNTRRNDSKSLLRSSYNEFERTCLNAHNEYRTRHGVHTLKLNKRLCRYAEEWAKVIAARGVLVHRNNSQYGENIFCTWSSSKIGNMTVKGEEPVENWYSEIDQHIFGKEPSTLKTGHFTQVVWKDSRELGVAVANNRSGQVFVVANYDPPGNYIGSFTKNVPPIGGFEDPKISIGKPLVERKIKRTGVEALATINNTHSKSTVAWRSAAIGGGMDKNIRNLDENDSEQFDEFSAAILKHHNAFRRKHGAGNLLLSGELVRDAQDWAETLAKNDRFTYRQNSKYGENFYCLWSSDRNARPNPRDVCRSWYEEMKKYTFDVEPRTSLRGGQFTQMVWKDTKNLGVGVGQARNGKVIVVCTYYPRGNVLGLFLKNVGRNNSL